jgi:hypothetical protein
VKLRALIRTFDTRLRRALGVFEFCQEPECLLRLQLAKARYNLCLPDMTIHAGEPVLLLHLWNERLPRIPAQGPDLGWARPMQRRFIYSMGLVAGYIQQSLKLVNVCAVGGVTVLAGPGNDGGRQMLQRLGFTVVPYHRRLGAFGEFWENFYTWLLMWAYNPGSLRYKHLWGLRREEMWISVEALLRRYG